MRRLRTREAVPPNPHTSGYTEQQFEIYGQNQAIRTRPVLFYSSAIEIA